MKFTLTYQGELRSNDDFRRKWKIRKCFDPQLQELWRIHPSLQSVKARRHLPSEGFTLWERHHSLPEDQSRTPKIVRAGALDLLAPLQVRGRQFVPMVRNSLALQCGLKILFLRKESEGRVYQGGDLDNRIKTLFDSLSVPNLDQIVDDNSSDPIHCLLEDDALITRIDVDSQRLLSSPNSSPHEVHLIIEVDIRVTDSRVYNQPFLGD